MGVRFRLSNRSFVKMIGRLAVRRLSNLNGAKQTRMALRRKMDFAHAESSMAEDATLVAVWAASFYWFMSIPQKGVPFSPSHRLRIQWIPTKAKALYCFPIPKIIKNLLSRKCTPKYYYLFVRLNVQVNSLNPY